MPRDIARQSEGEDCISLGIVGKEVVAIPVRGNSCRRLISSGGPCSVSCVSGRAYTVYLVQVRHKGQDYIIRRRFREFSALNDCIKDEDLRAIFPPRSLFAKAGLACALETRQSRLAYYIKELAHKLSGEPCKDKILTFLRATDLCTLEQDAAARPSFSHYDEKGERESSEMRPAIAASTQTIGLSMIRLSSAEHEAQAPKARHSFAEMAEHRAALSRLVPLLINGITVIKHGRRGSPKLRLIFCNEDFSRIFWASDRINSHKRSNLSSLSISNVTEVREGTAPDPHHPGLFGTVTLRRRRASSLAVPAIVSCSGSNNSSTGELQPIPRAFSLIAAARSLDLEALTADDYTLLLEGFRSAVKLNMAATSTAATAAETEVDVRGNKAVPAFG
ncbi:hypothetical protein VYU27_000244 [Nannochloropsis oceanica]